MKLNNLSRGSFASALFTVMSMLAVPAQGAAIWTDWTAATLGANGGGSATGTLGGVTVTYAGELDDVRINANSGVWAPNSSFIGGSSDTSPSSVNDDLRTTGNSTGINTITFSTPVVNPLFAIWSLGQPGLLASFNFISATPLFQAGGPNSQFAGAAITIVGNTVNGQEGNGVVQFTGTFSSISWTNTPESFYAFTVGGSGVPEPATMALVLTGLGLIGLGARRRR